MAAAPDEDDDLLSFLAGVADRARRDSATRVPPSHLEVSHRNQLRRTQGQLILEAAGTHGFDGEICTLPKPHFPALISPLNYQDASARDALGERVSSKAYSLSQPERDSVVAGWDPFDETAVDPELFPDLAAFHFQNAYRACIARLFGQKPPKSWMPLAPTMGNGRANGTCKRFATFLGNFCRNGFIYPHGWIFYRLNVLWEYGTLSDRVRNGTIRDYLRKYSTFLHVLDGNDCTTDPKKYQPYNRNWKSQFGFSDHEYTAVGEELRTLRRATVNRLARTSTFYRPTMSDATNASRARKALFDDAYFERRDDLIMRSTGESQRFRSKQVELVANGQWIWNWPHDGGEVCQAVKLIRGGKE